MIRVGLVSFGMASRVFHAPLISAVDGLELAAVVERNGRNAELDYPGITTYTSLEAMLADPSLELIVIPTPNPTHAPLAHQALESGRHVVVDKPVGIDSEEVRKLIDHATKARRLLIPFHNRRWDSDFRTLRQLLHEAILGNVNYFESTFDRWRPVPRLNMWKEDGQPGGGNLRDLGTHIVDQALQLFGLPEAVSAEVVVERENAVTDDAFTLRLRYPALQVTLSATCLGAIPRPRFTLRGTLGNFVKLGLDPQEARMKEHGTGSETPSSIWGEEPAAAWGTLAATTRGNEASNQFTTSRVESIPGDYRLFYEGVRDAVERQTPAPVLASEAFQVAQILDWARQSSGAGKEIRCEW